MPSLFIRIDGPLFKALNKIAPPAKRQRAEFIRQAVREAIRKREYEAIREAYLRQPDSSGDADDWSTPKRGSRETVGDLVGGTAPTQRSPRRAPAE